VDDVKEHGMVETLLDETLAVEGIDVNIWRL
jgi:hypothetical protein